MFWLQSLYRVRRFLQILLRWAEHFLTSGMKVSPIADRVFAAHKIIFSIIIMAPQFNIISLFSYRLRGVRKGGYEIWRLNKELAYLNFDFHIINDSKSIWRSPLKLWAWQMIWAEKRLDFTISLVKYKKIQRSLVLWHKTSQTKLTLLLSI